MSGAAFLVVDKPAGITSHDVVAIVRAVTGEKKVGHTGTLDPFATGALALALGGATRLVQYLDESLKVYDATIKLGTATDTGDPTGTVIRSRPVPPLDRSEVDNVLASFIGERMQTPPQYSAVKHHGKPLYSYARRGETVEVAARPITVHHIDLIDLGVDHLRIVLRCSRGTYARVLADEIGQALNTEGHLAALARLATGPFLNEGALTMPKLADIVALEPGAPWTDVLMSQGLPRDQRPRWRPRQEVVADLRPWTRTPLQALSHLALVDTSEAEAKRARSGTIPTRIPGGLRVGSRYLVVHGDELLAVAEASPRGARSLCVLGADA